MLSDHSVERGGGGGGGSIMGETQDLNLKCQIVLLCSLTLQMLKINVIH